MLGTVNPFSNWADRVQGSRMFWSPRFFRELNCSWQAWGRHLKLCIEDPLVVTTWGGGAVVGRVLLSCDGSSGWRQDGYGLKSLRLGEPDLNLVSAACQQVVWSCGLGQRVAVPSLSALLGICGHHSRDAL